MRLAAMMIWVRCFSFFLWAMRAIPTISQFTAKEWILDSLARSRQWARIRWDGPLERLLQKAVLNGKSIIYIIAVICCCMSRGFWILKARSIHFAADRRELWWDLILINRDSHPMFFTYIWFDRKPSRGCSPNIYPKKNQNWFRGHDKGSRTKASKLFFQASPDEKS